METNEQIEMMLWEYMDGTCPPADMQRISILIERDDMWKRKYAELSALHRSISDSMQLEQPSMRFSKNVMDTVATVNIAPATKVYINKGIIRGIAAFFIIAITSLIGYAFATANPNTGSTGILPKVNLNKVDLSSIFNSTTMNIIIAVNVAIALVLVDALLRRKKANQ